MKAGLIGLGAMGTGMARNIAKAGLLGGLYNRKASKAECLAAELNVSSFDDPEKLAKAVDIVLICISADQDVLDVVKAIAPGLRPSSVVVDLSTVSRETELKAAEITAVRGAQYLDAPVSGGVEGADKGTLAMMVGGPLEALQQALPVLSAMTTCIVYMGPTGAGQATKAVNQILCAGINEAVTEALAFGETQGLPMDKVIEVIAGGAAGNWFLDNRGLTMTQGLFKPGFKLALHHKDLKICQAMAAEAGVKIPLTDAAVEKYRQLMNQGYGDEDISAMYRLKRIGEPKSN